MFGVVNLMDWLTRLALVTGAALPATLLWLLLACGGRRIFSRWPMPAQWVTAAALGAAAGVAFGAAIAESFGWRIPFIAVGVIGVISPWNFPLHLTARSLAPALALGNAVVVKPASDTPVSGGLLLARIFEEAGLPAGVLSVVFLGPGNTTQLIYSLGIGPAFWLTLSLFNDLRQRIDHNDIPQPFKGLPVDLFSAGLMAVALLGLNAMIKP